MTLEKLQSFAAAGFFIALSMAPASAAVITFEDQLSSPGTFNNNAGASGAFATGGVSFSNNYVPDPQYPSWSGFAMSNTTDTTTPGFGNQYSAFPGSGADGSASYAVSFSNAAVKFNTIQNFAGFGASITNTTYAALSMRDGDGFAKKFGGVSGDDQDFFKLTLSGYASSAATGTLLDFYLADFRSTDNSQDYIVNSWKFVDFSALGAVDEIRFSYASSDIGQFGINTPTYFAIDNLIAVPEPSAALLGLLGSLALLGRRRRF